MSEVHSAIAAIRANVVHYAQTSEADPRRVSKYLAAISGEVELMKEALRESLKHLRTYLACADEFGDVALCVELEAKIEQVEMLLARTTLPQ